MLKQFALAVALVTLIASPALATDCEDLVEQVDDMLDEQGGTLTAETEAAILNLRNDGEADCSTGDEVEGIAKLETAISLFTQ